MIYSAKHKNLKIFCRFDAFVEIRNKYINKLSYTKYFSVGYF